MLLEYEKEVLREANGQSCLLVAAGGLNIQKIILVNIGFYLNRNSLVLLLNLLPDDRDAVFALDSPFLRDVGALHRTKRGKRYLEGGVFVASSRVFVADMIDGTLDVESISCILINSVETVAEASSEAFIVHMFRKRNKTGLVKGFSECPVPLSLGFSPLDRKMRSLRVSKVLFLPRFHKSVEESLNGDVDLVEMLVRLSEKTAQIQVVLMDIIDGLLRTVLRGADKQEIDSEMIVFGSLRKIFKTAGISSQRILEDVHNVRTLLFLLFSCDAATFHWSVMRVFREQVALGKDSTWINMPMSHVLVDKAGELLDEALEKVRRQFGDVSVSRDAFNGADEDGDEETKRHRMCLSDLPEEAARCFYCCNPKIKRLLDVLDSLCGRSLILVSGLAVRDALMDIVGRFAGNQSLRVLTHHEFKYYGEEYENAVFVEPSQESVRKIEIHGIAHKVRVYFLVYSGSLEEQRYLNEIRREKAAFEKLIEERARLPLRLDDEDEAIDLEEHEEAAREYAVVVDVRELRSDLPFYLFKAQNRICMSTLAVGDYLVGPSTCIERKAVADFISSLATGRLYQQATMLCHKFSNPVLLLEFDGRPCLSDHYSHNQDTFKNSVVARFMLFLASFSQIRVVWSDSRLFSTKIIRDLQRREEHAPVAEESGLDPTLQEILLGIPGITVFNLRRAVRGFASLREIVFAARERLEEVLGAESAVKVHGFFRRVL